MRDPLKEEKEYVERESLPLWFVIFLCVCYLAVVLVVVYLLSTV